MQHYYVIAVKDGGLWYSLNEDKLFQTSLGLLQFLKRWIPGSKSL